MHFLRMYHNSRWTLKIAVFFERILANVNFIHFKKLNYELFCDTFYTNWESKCLSHHTIIVSRSSSILFFYFLFDFLWIEKSENQSWTQYWYIRLCELNQKCLFSRPFVIFLTFIRLVQLIELFFNVFIWTLTELITVEIYSWLGYKLNFIVTISI